MRTTLVAFVAAAAIGLSGCDKPAPQSGTQNQAQPSQTTAAVSTSVAPPPAGTAKDYDCKAVLSNAEALSATGLNFELTEAKNGAADPYPGYTDCGYFAGDGTYMQVTLWTGPAYQQGFVPQLQAARSGGAEPITGIGDEAGWSTAGSVFGVRVGNAGITIAFAFAQSRQEAELKQWARKVATVVIGRL